ncbi:MAG: flagellar filament capping protein FliD [Candidatus Methylomirabilales bacterium]
MAGSLGVSGATGGSAGLTSAYFNQLIALQLQQEKAPLRALETDKSALAVRRGIYVDTKILLSGLNNLAGELRDTGTAVYAAKAVTSSDPAAVSATGGSGALPGSHALAVTTLAKAHRVRSDAQASADQPLGLTGTFVIGGAPSRAVSGAAPVAGTVTGFGTAGLRSGQTELGSGSYAVEILNQDGTFRFRLVDAEGRAVSIARAGGLSAGMTSDWQDLAPVAGQAYDTGRGLTISFGTGPFAAGSRQAGAAEVTYTAQGASITVSAADSLTRIRDLVNGASYAEDNGVLASVVDRTLVLTATATGARHALAANDGTGTVLQSLGVLSGAAFKNSLQDPADAAFSVNGMTIARSRNTGLEDVVQGVSLGLLAEGKSATVSVTPDATAITEKISAVLRKFNEVMDYLKGKLQVEKDEGSNTYTRGGLAGESVFRTLRQDLVAALRGRRAGAGTALDEAADLGIRADGALHFSVADSARLQAAIQTNLAGVRAVLDDRMAALQAALAPFLRATTGALDARIAAVDKRTAQVEARVAQIEKRVGLVETQLVKRYGTILSQTPAYTRDQATAGILLSRSVLA